MQKLIWICWYINNGLGPIRFWCLSFKLDLDPIVDIIFVVTRESESDYEDNINYLLLNVLLGGHGGVNINTSIYDIKYK